SVAFHQSSKSLLNSLGLSVGRVVNFCGDGVYAVRSSGSSPRNMKKYVTRSGVSMPRSPRRKRREALFSMTGYSTRSFSSVTVQRSSLGGADDEPGARLIVARPVRDGSPR